jgi:hypothetical protein
MNIRNMFGLSPQLRAAIAPIMLSMGGGNVYYAIQSTDTIYGYFVDKYYEEYPDGTKSIYNTIQGALDVCVRDRGDMVIIIGGWTITTALSVDRIYGLKIIGGNPFETSRGGPAEITYAGTGTAFTLSSAKVWLSDITFYMTGTGAPVCLDISGRVFSHGVIKNVNIRKMGGTDAQGHAIKAGSPSSSTFENIQINSDAGNAKRWQTGILMTGDDLCHFKGIEVGGTEGFAIYNPGSTRSLYEDIRVMPSCNDGLTLTGVTSSLINSRNMAAAPGPCTMIRSGCYTTGLTEYTT